MKSVARFAVLGAVLAGASAAAAQDIQFFEHPDFNGRRFAANQSVSNLADQGFNDRASSVVVRSGTWQLCSDAYFRGRCVTLPPGEYRNLSQIGLANEVSSARELGIVPGGPGPGGPGRTATLYEDYSFGGRSIDVNGAIVNLGRTEFNDRARSLVVHGGTWELCRDDNFQGGCQTFGPGRHANIGYLAGEASSLRPVGGGPGPGPGPGPGGPPDGWGGGARVILYEQPGFGGRRVAFSQEFMPNFDGAGFNDRASSLRVERGYWMFCSDAGFRGTCRTFGPGDYPNLPPGLNNQLSSGRLIHNEYPYNSSPNWSGYTQQ